MNDPHWYWRALGYGLAFWFVGFFWIVNSSLSHWLYANEWLTVGLVLMGPAVFGTAAIEIANTSRLSAWRSPPVLGEALGEAILWIVITIGAAWWALVFAVEFQNYIRGHGGAVTPTTRTLLMYGFMLAAAAIVWRTRVWVVQQRDEGLDRWQILRAALRGIVSGAHDRASRVQLLTTGLPSLVGGGGLFWLLLTYIPADAMGEWDWWVRWGFVTSFVLLGVYFVSMAARGLAGVFGALVGAQPQSNTHGSARWARESELRGANLSPHRNGIYLGKFLNLNQPKQDRDSVQYPGDVHLITVGMTGSGKGSGLIIPNLSTLRRSILIIDPKGQAAAITARKRATFGRVVMLNPFNTFANTLPWMASEGFNPLATVRTDENFVDDCTVIAQALVKQEKGSSGRFFSGSAHDLVTALIMHEKLTNGAGASLAHVRALLTEPIGSAQGVPTGISRTIFDMAQSTYAPLRAKAGRFMGPTDSNRDIISTAVNEMSFIDSPQIGRDLSSSSNFSFADMKAGITTCYLVLPVDRLQSHANWLRLMISCALRELLSGPGAGGVGSVLFMLDEFAQLDHLPMISTAMNIARSYGVQLWPFVQDLNQLKNIYEDNWQNFVGASAALTAFAPRDLFTAEYLSKMCGDKTIIVESQNARGASGTGSSRGPQGVPLIRPEELSAMPEGQMLSFVNPVKQPFMARAPGYWTMPIFNQGLDKDPYHPN